MRRYNSRIDLDVSYRFLELGTNTAQLTQTGIGSIGSISSTMTAKAIGRSWRQARQDADKADLRKHSRPICVPLPITEEQAVPRLPNLPAYAAVCGAIAALVIVTATGQGEAGCLEPREIPLARRNVARELEATTRSQPIERGLKRPVIDGIGWVVGIPRKIILWDIRVDNHDVSPGTEEAIENYLAENELDHVKVRINQYAPVSDWRRLRQNTVVAWPYRYTLGVISVACEAVLPGRVFGRDYYNPYTATVHIFSDVPALAVKQAGHSKDYTRRTYPGTYSLTSIVPLLDLWPQAIATGDAIAFAERHGDADLEREEYRVLYPAYGSSMGGVVGDVVAGAFLPIYAGTVVAGHVVGRWEARRVDDRLASLVQMVDEEPFATILDSAIERLTEAEAGESQPYHAADRLAPCGADAALLPSATAVSR